MTTSHKLGSGGVIPADASNPCASCLHGAAHHQDGTPGAICTLDACPGCTGYARSTTL